MQRNKKKKKMTQLPMYVLSDFQKSLKEVSVVDGMVYTHPPTHPHTHTHTQSHPFQG